MPYHTNEDLLTATRLLAAQAGERADLRTVGQTCAGRPIVAVTIALPGRPPAPTRPQVLVTGNLHGNEVIGSELALRLLELLAAPSPDEDARALLEAADVTIVPAINLDSRDAGARALAAGRGFARSPRGNPHGVDLNRNFPFPATARDAWHPLAGTRHAWLPWYRGPHPLAEPEAQAVADLAQRLRPRASLTLHSVGELVLYPWCHSPEPPADREAFLALAAAFTAAQPGRPYRVKQARAWYTILGDLDDWLYATFGTLALTIELAAPLAGVGRNPLRLLSPLAWMNPRDPEPTLAITAIPCLRLLGEGVRQAAAPCQDRG